MYQTIGEAIEVIGVYARQTFTPRKFLWNHREYLIERTTAVISIRDGTTRKRRYAVMSGSTSYRLLFNRDAEVWTLEELWVE